MAAPTSGWIAAGFNEKPQLQNTWFVIAAVSVSPIVVEEHIALVPDHKAVERLGLRPVIADAAGTMDNGISTLTFSLPHAAPGPGARTGQTSPTDAGLVRANRFSAPFGLAPALRHHALIPNPNS